MKRNNILLVQEGTTKFRVAETQNGRTVDGFTLSFHIRPGASRQEITVLLEEKLSGRGLKLETAEELPDGWQVRANHMTANQRD